MSLAGLTREKRDQLLRQRETQMQLREEKTEKLLRLKEEREDMKERGFKHEDELMRENAKLQVH